MADERVSVFVIDDHPSVRQGYKTMIEATGRYEVVGLAASTEEAKLQISTLGAEGRMPAIIIVDINLKGQSGIDFVRAIRLDTRHVRRTIPMVITMGTARRISVGQARDSGANFVLSKPVSALVLYDRLTWIARQPRPFWESETYFGPDRRFRALRHKGMPKRRSGDEDEINIEDDHAA